MALRQRAQATLAKARQDAHLDTAFDAKAIHHVLHQRLVSLRRGPGALSFGRIDGKTAVGLHRAAFLLYEHRETFRRMPLLVVGPNPLFLAYISEVLPSLGETSVVQTTIELLLRKYRLGSTDTTKATMVKGDARMRWSSPTLCANVSAPE